MLSCHEVSSNQHLHQQCEMYHPPLAAKPSGPEMSHAAHQAMTAMGHVGASHQRLCYQAVTSQ
jgi:hypothetical protein